MLVLALFTLFLFVLALAYTLILSFRLVLCWSSHGLLSVRRDDTSKRSLAESLKRATQEITAILGIGDD